MFIVVSKAHLYAPVRGEVKVYVYLSPECGKPGKCGRLAYWLYGMRPASRGWQDEYTRRLISLGFKAGEASRVVSVGIQMGWPVSCTGII